MSEDNVIFTIGCDPEVFLMTPTRGKVKSMFVSAEGVIPGDKKNPHRVERGALQLDGLAAEFNTLPVQMHSPNSYAVGGNLGKSDFNSNILSVLAEIDSRAKEAKLKLSKESYAEFDREYYDSLSEESKELGCDPDFNAYTGDMNEIDRSSELENVRGAAGHIHIGWGQDIPVDHPDHLAICRDVVRAMDRWVMLRLIVAGDTDVRRRKVYGKAGAFRPKSYGVEYRVPSNWWIWSVTRRHLVWYGSILCVKDLARNRMFEKIEDSVVVDIINNPDLSDFERSQLARDLLQTHGLWYGV